MADVRDVAFSRKLRALETQLTSTCPHTGADGDKDAWLELAWLVHMSNTPTFLPIPEDIDIEFRAQLACSGRCVCRRRTIRYTPCVISDSELCSECALIQSIRDARDYEAQLIETDDGYRQVRMEDYIFS